MTEAIEVLEKIGVGFAATGGVADCQPGQAVLEEIISAKDCEAHGKTMVFVGVDFKELLLGAGFAGTVF
jgi:hypothetical protein